MTNALNEPVMRLKKKRLKMILLIAVPLALILFAVVALLLSMRAGVFIDRLEFEESEVTVQVGESHAMAILFSPGFVTDKNLTFESSDQAIAAIGDNGVVTGVQNGQAVVTVRHIKSGKSAQAVVHVETPKVLPTAIGLNNSQLALAQGETFTLTVVFEPSNATETSITWTTSDNTIATVDETGKVTAVAEGSCTITAAADNVPGLTTSAAVTVAASGTTIEVPVQEDRPEPVIEEKYGVTYVNGIVIVNKTYSCPDDYAPGIDPDCRAAFYEMQAAAADEGLDIWVLSAYRSYETQETLYNNYVARDGKEEADRYSARPGHSEHHTGLCYDVNSVDYAFADTPEGQWLAAHCYEYGFIIRYPEDGEEYTGYRYEPWHIRYLGVELATLVHDSGLTLEQYLGITSEYAD